ncbi:MAG TPA: PH domain-containing protein [Oligoflexia bacterium]|nr:PH domain-containing protein [Oligoflexia bacterium]HMP47391.1 PH domain-containing protein [Oligoflexia bacterium]
MNFLRQKIIDKYSRGGEEIPHSSWSVVPRFLIFIGYVIFLELIYLVFPGILDYMINNFGPALVFISVIVFLVFVVRPIIGLFNSYHELTLDNLVSVQGFASPFRREHLCPYIFIVGVEVQQNLFERLTDMGRLLVGTSMTGHAEIVLKNIQRPNEYAAKLLARVGEASNDL